MKGTRIAIEANKLFENCVFKLSDNITQHFK